MKKQMEVPRAMVVKLKRKQRVKIQKHADYGDRSKFVRDAIDAYAGPFAPRPQEDMKKIEETGFRLYKKQRAKIAQNAEKGYRSQYIRAAIDAFDPSAKEINTLQQP